MQRLSVWSAALMLAGVSATADAALVETQAFEQSPIQGRAIEGFRAPAAKSHAQYGAEMAQLHAWLTAAEPAAKGRAPGLRVELTPQQKFSIGEIDSCPGCDDVSSTERRLLVGVSSPVGAHVDIATMHNKAGLRHTDDGGFAYTTSVTSVGASAVRVAFSDLNLPVGAELYVYNAAGEAHGPYTGRGMHNTGELVSNSVTGDTAFVQLRMNGKPNQADLARLNFTISEVGHIGPRFELARRLNASMGGAKAFCDYNATCIINGECASGWSPLANTRQAIAHILFQSGGGYYICSGGLVNNTRNDGTPLFMTAHHCIGRDREAASLEAFFDFRAASCGDTGWCNYSYSQLRSSFPSTLGATLLASGSGGDYSLMQLDATPAGSRYYMGWSTTAVANTDGTPLYRISHPQGAPQSWSTQDVTANGFTCGTLPRGQFIYSNDTAGATEGGSSGSPVLNASGQVVGQLYGACGSNLNDVCDSSNNETVDGAMAYYFPNVEPYLDPAGGGGGGGGGGSIASVDSVSISSTSKGPWHHYTATVVIRDESGNPIGSATVSGNWSGALSGSDSGTTDGSGTAQITDKTRSSGSATFCVTGVAASGYTFDGTQVCGSGN